MSLKIEHAHLVLPYQVLQDAWLISREGKITAYGCGVSPQQTFSTVIDAKGQYLTPGFVDLHVHGGAGADFRDGEEAAFVQAMQALSLIHISADGVRCVPAYGTPPARLSGDPTGPWPALT